MITNTQYRNIIAEYEQTQTANRHTQTLRREEVYARIPEYETLEKSVSTLCIAQGRKMLAGDTQALSDMKQELHALTDRKQALLVSHGYPADYLENIYTCSDCRDTGYLEDKSKCHCMKQKIASLLYEQSGLTSLLATDNFAHISSEFYEGEDLVRFEKSVATAKNFVSDFSSHYRNLLFYGTVGTGKTFLSCCIAKELLDQGYQVIYFSACSLFDKISEYTFRSRDKAGLAQFYDDLYGCDLLIIDDLGTELVNSFVASELFTCLNERHLRKRSTIISSNISLEELSDHYSERLFSRITSNYELLKFTGQDIRMYKKRIANRK